MARMRFLAAALLAGLAILTAPQVVAEVKLDDADYPTKGKAIDALEPAADYSDVLMQRPRAVAIMRTRDHGFVPSPALHDYVKGVLTRVLADIKLPRSYQPDVRILASPELSAICMPDGTIVVTVGLLEQIESEDELAFVLAHESSHAIYRHHASDWFARSQYYGVMNATALDKTRAAAGAGSAGLNTNIARGIDVAQHFYTLSENVLAPQFKQGQEDQADALGLDLMVKAGYNPEGASTLLGRLAQVEEATEKQAQQAESSKGWASGNGISGAVGNVVGALTGSITDIASVAISVFDTGVDTFAKESRTHRKASDRVDLVSQYQFREYRRLLPGNLKPLPWQTAKNGPLALVIAHYEDADRVADFAAGTSNQSGQTQTPAQAAAAVGRATHSPTSDHAYTQFAASRYYEMHHDGARAQAALNSAVKSPEPSWIAYSALIDDDIKRGDYTSAQAVMTNAVTRFEDSPVLLPKRIEILHHLGRQGEAENLLSQCDSYDIKELYTECEKAAGKA